MTQISADKEKREKERRGEERRGEERRGEERRGEERRGEEREPLMTQIFADGGREKREENRKRFQD